MQRLVDGLGLGVVLAAGVVAASVLDGGTSDSNGPTPTVEAVTQPMSQAYVAWTSPEIAALRANAIVMAVVVNVGELQTHTSSIQTMGADYPSIEYRIVTLKVFEEWSGTTAGRVDVAVKPADYDYDHADWVVGETVLAYLDMTASPIPGTSASLLQGMTVADGIVRGNSAVSMGYDMPVDEVRARIEAANGR